MKFSPAFAAAALLTGLALAQDKAVSPWDVLLKNEKALKAIPGMIEMTVGAVNGEKRIVIRVEDDRAREAVRALLGEKADGFPVHIIISRPASADPGGCTHCPIHCKGSGQTVASPGAAGSGSGPGSTKIDMNRLDDPSYANERCDIIRKWTGQSKRTDGEPYCIEMVSWSNDPAKIKWVIEQGLPHWRSKEMPGLRGSEVGGLPCAEHGNHGGGEIICYTWIKHRQFCPLGMKQVMREIQESTPTRGSKP